MANRPKQKGTNRETWWVRAFEAVGIPARRWENNAPGRDVDCEADRIRIWEVKDRQNLNVHKTLKDTLDRWPSYPAGVLWHRTSRKAGNTRLSPDGPTIAAIPADDMVDLLRIARAADAVVRYASDPESLDTAIENLREAIGEVDARYPLSRSEA